MKGLKYFERICVLIIIGLIVLIAFVACGGDDDKGDPCGGQCDEYGRPIYPVDPPEPPVKVGEVDELGQVQQAGYLDAEIVVFPDGSKFNCVSSDEGGLQCFPIKIGAQ